MKHILKRLFKSKIHHVTLILLEHNEKIEKIWEGKINNPKNNGKRKRKIPTIFKMIIGSYQVIFFKTILLKLVTKGNSSDVTEVPELGSKLRTWLQHICCALAR